MLILAGVSISLVLSNNGVISKSKDARDQYSQAQENEANHFNETAEWIEQEVTDNGETNTPTTGNAGTITAADYGKVVTNYQTGTSNVWEIFYADNNNVYLITRNNTGNQVLKDKIPGYNGTSDFDGSEAFKAKFPAVQAGWLDKTYTPAASGAGTINYTSSYENMKATEYLLDSSVWNANYKTEKADWAIGAPTLELFVAAYNKVYTSKAVTITTLTGNGYLYNDALYQDNSLPSSDSVTTGTAKSNLFNHGYSYWLACPSSSSYNFVRIVDYDSACVVGNNYGSSSSSNGTGVRPVVCLSSGVTLTPSSDRSTFTIN